MKRVLSRRTAAGILLGCGLFFSGCGQNLDWSPFDTDSVSGLPKGIHSASKARLTRSQRDCTGFSVGVIGDVHDTYRGFEEAIDRLNRRNVAFVVVVGDIVNRGLVNEYENFMSSAKRMRHPWFSVIGNHDAIGHGKEMHRRIFGPANDFFDHCGVRFVLWNNNTLAFGNRAPDYGFLSSATNANRVVAISHIPPADEEFRDRKSLPIDFFRKTKTVLSLSGHYHGHGWKNVDGIPQLIAERAKHGRFYVVKFTPDDIEVEKCGATCERL